MKTYLDSEGRKVSASSVLIRYRCECGRAFYDSVQPLENVKCCGRVRLATKDEAVPYRSRDGKGSGTFPVRVSIGRVR